MCVCVCVYVYLSLKKGSSCNQTKNNKMFWSQTYSSSDVWNKNFNRSLSCFCLRSCFDNTLFSSMSTCFWSIRVSWSIVARQYICIVYIFQSMYCLFICHCEHWWCESTDYNNPSDVRATWGSSESDTLCLDVTHAVYFRDFLWNSVLTLSWTDIQPGTAE